MKSVSTRDLMMEAYEKTLPDVMSKLTKYCDNERKICGTLKRGKLQLNYHEFKFIFVNKLK